MKSSNLAERLEEYEAAVEAAKKSASHVVAAADGQKPARPPRRLSFDTRRIQIRDAGLAPFRVF